MEKLTARQQEVLDAVRELTTRRGWPPTVRELAAFLEIGPRAAFEHIAALVRKGYLDKEEGRPRAIHVPGMMSLQEGVELPIIGRVAAGPPILALEEREGTMTVDRTMAAAQGDFILRVKGDSMEGDHIVEGDLVIVRPQPVAENGAIVVALVAGEATVKRMYLRAGKVILRASNPRYADLVIGEDEGVAVVGRVVGVIRRYK